jgi:hypothetical protein
MKTFWGILCLFYYAAAYCDCFSPYPTVSQRPQIRIGKPAQTIHSEILKTATRRKYSHLDSFSASASESALFSNSFNNVKQLGQLKAAITKAGMMAFIVSMCMTLPIVLMPQYLLYKMGLIDRIKKEQMALHAGQFCARWMLRLIPFSSVKTIPYHDPSPEPSIWVCNHVSALDIFMLLATDFKLRGKNKRPIKIVYVRIPQLLMESTSLLVVMSPQSNYPDSFLIVETTGRQSNYATLVSTMWIHLCANDRQ